MTKLLDLRIPRTLDRLVERYSRNVEDIECWVFEDELARTRAEARLLASGVRARVRSAYKPLLHFFLEEVQLSGLTSVSIEPPNHATALPQRFQMEAYPLAALLNGVPLHFTPGLRELDYVVALEYGDRKIEHLVFAPNRMRTSHLGETVLAPCGWIRTDAGRGEPIETEYEAVFAAVMRTLADHPWGDTAPYFEELAIDVSISGIERRLPFGDECLSTGEALHEDFYFSLREFFCKRAGLPPGDRYLQMGQIIPDIRLSEGDAIIRVETRSAQPLAPHVPFQQLDSAAFPLAASQVEAEVASLGGTRFDGVSDQGRSIPATRVDGTGPHFVLSAGQHANEPSGIIGALRAAAILREHGASFSVIPLENPDGYALSLRLRSSNPRHINHAARYTALGDDIQHRKAEASRGRNARLNALQETGALLHINLHGYPAHEFVRPFSGYLPEGSAVWAAPRGFFLIASYRPGFEKVATDFVFKIARRVALVPGLKQYNETHLAAYRAHVGELSDPVVDSICCVIHEDKRHANPVVIATEFPDETVYGDHFVLGHTAQMATAVAAADIYREGLIDLAHTD